MDQPTEGFIDIRTAVQESGQVRVTIMAEHEPLSNTLLTGVFKSSDVAEVVCAALDAYYSQHFAGMVEGVRIIDTHPSAR
jgi:hypothetical protein